MFKKPAATCALCLIVIFLVWKYNRALKSMPECIESFGRVTYVSNVPREHDIIANHSVYATSWLSRNSCELPVGGYKGWNAGVVTVLSPEVPVNCSKVMARDEDEIERVNETVTQWKNAIADEDMLKKVENCSWLVEYFSNNLYNSEVEVSFPIAFIFVVYDSPQQILRLLRLLYRPQNSYCIHCDQKSPHKVFFASIAKCLDNVVVPSKLESVVWGHYSVLGAQMNCMTELLELRKKWAHKWKYVINLCGKELPKATNRRIVERLMKLKGSSSIMTYQDLRPELIQDRMKYVTELSSDGDKAFTNKKRQLDKPPFSLQQYYKSSSYNLISYEFANYLVTNATAIRILNFFKKTRSPEEHFYATLFRMPGVPGGFNEDVKGDYFYVAGVFWKKLEHHCSGKMVNKVCILGVGDLYDVIAGNHIFFNKYFMDYDPTVMQCMEERIVELNRQEYQRDC